MRDEVVYLGFKVSKNGMLTVKKIDTIKSAKKTENISEVISFVGLLNYYL